MGDLVRAICKCGYESEPLQIGVGFDFIETGSTYTVGYCDHCENVQTLDDQDQPSRCETCNHLMTVYEDDLHKIAPRYEGYSETEKRWYCPRCKSNNLQFELAGLWD